MTRILLATFASLSIASATAHAQETSSSPDVPRIATEISIEGLTLNVKALRISVALSPKEIEGIVKALQGSGAKVTTAPGVPESNEPAD